MSKIVLGAREEIVIKGKSGEKKVMARIDTGAKTCSIDMALAEEIGIGPVMSVKKVWSSNGDSVRSVVEAKIVLGGRELVSEFTMIDRSHMRYPVLIGRRVLEDGFVVDPSKK
jgi:hypothetical protein